jgi:acetylornithine deacetylase/succinyl-diaminopimelate desuccinylase family protein
MVPRDIDPDRLTTLLAELVSANSANPPGREAAVVAVLVGHLERHGLQATVVEVLPGRSNVSVAIGTGEGPVLLLNAHTDTMPAGEEWSRDPFEAHVQDGELFGLGACDAKGGLAAMVEAVIVLADRGPHLRGRVILDAVIDEEGAAAGTRAAVAAGRQADWAIVAEPTDLSVARLSNGQLGFEVLLHGRAAHGSTPDDGLSAIAGAADLVRRIEAAHASLRVRPHPILGPATLSVGTIRGGIQASIVAAECRIEIDRRVLPGSSLAEAVAGVDRLLAEVRADRPGLEIARTVTLAIPPVAVPESSPVCVALAGALEASGVPSVIGGLRATSDAAWLDAAGIPSVVFGPGSLAYAHRPDERVALAEVHAAARVLVSAAMQLVG